MKKQIKAFLTKTKALINLLNPYLQFIGTVIGIIVNIFKVFPLKAKKPVKYVSKCCGAEMTLESSPDFIGDQMNRNSICTCNYYCTKCGEPCDIKEKK